YAEYLEVWHGQRCLEKIPRLRGTGKYRVNYRHIIDWLVRKPGAFENYRYQSGLFPSSRFRMAYDSLKKRHAVSVAAKQYLRILHLAAQESESLVEDALRLLLDREEVITAESVKAIVFSDAWMQPVTEVAIAPVVLENYDQLLPNTGVTA
ncbi:MAG: IS21 family transposase, partial [Pseudomonadota bacterium]|nr:IS21 family transposase [Pseudomonadota bacterium]